MPEIRRLNAWDYFKNYLDLLEDLTIVDRNGITEDMFKDQLDKIEGEIYVMEEDGVIVSTGTLLIEHKFIHKCGKVGHIEDIVVKSDCRDKGYGKAIINCLSKRAQELGCYKVILDCSKNNRIFYNKCGFVEKGIEMAKYF